MPIGRYEHRSFSSPLKRTNVPYARVYAFLPHCISTRPLKEEAALPTMMLNVALVRTSALDISSFGFWAIGEGSFFVLGVAIASSFLNRFFDRAETRS
jgi:hypothetical protein